MRAPAGAALFALALASAAAGAATPEVEIYLRPVTSFWEHFEEGRFGAPRGIFYDRENDEVWIADTRNDRVAIFTPDGLPLYTAIPGGGVHEPTRLVVDGEGNVLLLDSDRSRIARLDWRGHYVGPLELPGLSANPSIAALELDDEGNLYVGDDAAGEVVVFGPDRRVRLRFGRRGDGKGEFKSIADIAVDAEHIVVIDHVAQPVQIFDRHGNFERGFGQHQMGAENFSLPAAATFDSSGRLVVVDALRHEIKLFTIDGKFIERFGGYGTAPGRVAGPSDVASDGKKLLYVTERIGGRVQVFEELERPAPPKPRRPARRVRPPGS